MVIQILKTCVNINEKYKVVFVDVDQSRRSFVRSKKLVSRSRDSLVVKMFLLFPPRSFVKTCGRRKYRVFVQFPLPQKHEKAFVFVQYV